MRRKSNAKKEIQCEERDTMRRKSNAKKEIQCEERVMRRKRYNAKKEIQCEERDTMQWTKGQTMIYKIQHIKLKIE